MNPTPNTPNPAPASAPKNATEDFVTKAVEKLGKEITDKLKPFTEAVTKLSGGKAPDAAATTTAGTTTETKPAAASGAEGPRVISAEDDAKTFLGRSGRNSWIRNPLAMLGIGTGTALSAPTAGLGALAAGPALWAAGKMKSWFTRKEYPGVTRPIYEAMITPVQLAAAPFKLTHRAIMDGPGYIGGKMKEAYGWVKDHPYKAMTGAASAVWNSAVKPVIQPTLPGVSLGFLGASAALMSTGSLMTGGVAGIAGYGLINYLKHKGYLNRTGAKTATGAA